MNIINKIVNFMYILKNMEQKEIDKIKIPLCIFRAGDTIEIKIWVAEGIKKRLQVFEGIVIAIRNRGLNSSFTVRKFSNGEGIERIFQRYSPIINSIIITRYGAVRKAKLYYLRHRTGKNARIKERIATR